MQQGRWTLLAIAMAVTTVDLAGQSPIDTLALRAHTYFLSHDAVAGRATGSAGAALAALYITSQCRELGLQPVGSEYGHGVPLEEATVRSASAAVTRSGISLQFHYPGDFTPDVGSRSTLVGFGGPAVYVGRADELQAASLEGLALGGSVAVILGPRANVESVEELRARGVVGAILLAPDTGTYGAYRRNRGRTRLYHADPAIRSSTIPPLPAVIAGPELSFALVAGAPLDGAGRPAHGPLERSITIELGVDLRTVPAENVVCMLPGAHKPASDTALALSAHYDHLGVVSESRSGDSIYNGFSDNAAGVAALLAIAKALAEDNANPLRHTTLFLFFVGEERGLLGSDYYAARPSWPLSRTKAVINIDAGAPPGRPTSWRLAGVDSTGLGAVGIRVAAEHGWRVTTSAPRANSDYYPFVREGVPGVFIIPGPDPYEGLTPDSSAALRERWDHYHQPDDEWSEEFPFAGLRRYAEFGLLFARAVDRHTSPLRH
jgi:hypothetical protein